MILIDSHCHLDYFAADELPSVLARAGAAGVAEMVTIGTRLGQASESQALAEANANVWYTVGVHPHNAAEVPVQQDNFRAHIRAAQATGLPLVIHARDADADIARLLQEERDRGGAFAFLLHCFSSGRPLAEAAVEQGGYVSFSGILTFPKSTELRDVARDLPAERLLVETDSPYLAPVPLRGKRNEPALVAHTARVLAETRGLEPDALAALTTANFRRLFRKAA
jgi:TatD DNase family protein